MIKLFKVKLPRNISEATNEYFGESRANRSVSRKGIAVPAEIFLKEKQGFTKKASNPQPRSSCSSAPGVPPGK